MPLLNFTGLDFEQIKTTLKDYLKSNSDFTDYDFEGSNLSTILNVLAYNTYITSYNANMVSNEVFIDSATLRENVVALARNIGYLPRSKKAAKATINFFCDISSVSPAPPTVVLKKGAVVGTMLKYVGVPVVFTLGEQITGGTSGATANVVNVQSEPKTIYIVNQSGTFTAGEVITGGSSGASITLDTGGSFASNQSGRILVSTFATSPNTGDSVQFATTDGNAYQIQSLSTITVASTEYKIIVFSTSRATPVPSSTVINCRKRFSTVRLTGHDFLKVGTGDKTTTNWPGEPTQPPSQADQITTLATDPGRVYYVATDELGNFYVGDYFKVDQATGNVTLDASAFNLQGLQSLQLGAIGGLIGASINEFSTDGDMSQNSDVKVPTQAAIRTYVGKISAVNPGGAGSGTLTITGNQVISGDLTVNGTTTTVNSTNTTITDKLLELGTGTTGSPSGDVGLIFERGDSNNACILYDESEDKFRFATTTATGASSGDITFVDARSTILANIEGTLTGNASSATVANGLQNSPNITVGTIGCGNITSSGTLGCGTITSTGEISDSIGSLRRVPANSQGSAYTLQASDSGKYISTSNSVTVPSGIFVAGMVVSIFNASGSSIQVTQGSGVTLRLVGKADTGNRTLALRGLATILCVASNEFVITGGGVS